MLQRVTEVLLAGGRGPENEPTDPASPRGLTMQTLDGPGRVASGTEGWATSPFTDNRRKWTCNCSLETPA